MLPKALIIGSEYFVDSTSAGIIAKLDDPESHYYYAEEFEPDEFFNTLFTPSLFNEYKLLVLKHAEHIKKPDEFLANIARSGAAAAVILSSSDGKKSAGLQKAAKASGFELIAEGKKTGAKPADVKAAFAAQGCPVDDATASQIALLTEGDMTKIQAEAAKLALYFAGKKPTASEILANISGQQNESIFAFLDAFMDRQRAKCLHLYPLFPSVDGVFYMLITYMAGLYFKLTDERLYGTANPFFNGKTYFMRTVDKTYRKWKAAEAAKIIDMMARLDLAVKTGKTDIADSMLMLIKEL